MSFLQSESGAISVDWVFLSALCVGMGVATMGVVSAGSQTASDNIAGQMSSMDPSLPTWDREGLIDAHFRDEVYRSELTRLRDVWSDPSAASDEDLEAGIEAGLAVARQLEAVGEYDEARVALDRTHAAIEAAEAEGRSIDTAPLRGTHGTLSEGLSDRPGDPAFDPNQSELMQELGVVA